MLQVDGLPPAPVSKSNYISSVQYPLGSLSHPLGGPKKATHLKRNKICGNSHVQLVVAPARVEHRYPEEATRGGGEAAQCVSQEKCKVKIHPT